MVRAAAWSPSGILRDDAGDLEEEEEIDRRALAIMEKIDETDTHARTPGLLNNLGEIYPPEAGLRARRGALPALARPIGERLRGPESYSVATALQNLGIVARERKDYRRGRGVTTGARWRSGSGSSGPIIRTSPSS